MIQKLMHELQDREKPNTSRMGSGFIADSMTRIVRWDSKTGELVWDANQRSSYITKVLQYKNCFVTRMPVYQTGAFWNETIYSPRDVKNSRGLKIQLKSSQKESNLEGILDPKRYGGPKGVAQAYWFIYCAKNRRGQVKYFFEGVPLYLKEQIEREGIQAYAEVCAQEKGLVDAKVLKERVLLGQRFEMDGRPYYLSGSCSSGNRYKPAYELVADSNTTSMINRLYKGGEPLTGSECDELYRWLRDSFEKVSPTLASCLSATGRYERFHDLPIDEKVKLLTAIVDRLHSKREMNLKSIGGAVSSGTLSFRFGKKLRSIVWVDQSVTGIYERRITSEDLCRGI